LGYGNQQAIAKLSEWSSHFAITFATERASPIKRMSDGIPLDNEGLQPLS
jgi:hypothetical protein